MSLKIQVRTGKALEASAEVLAVVLPAFQLVKKKGKEALPAPLDEIDAAVDGALLALVKKEEFSAKKDQVLAFSPHGRLGFDRVLLCGTGDAALDTAAARTLAAKIARSAQGEKAKSLAIALPESLLTELRPLAEGIELGAYRFTKYFTGDKAPKTALAAVSFVTGAKVSADARRAVELGAQIGAAVNVARDLSNEPPNVIFPESLADAAVAMAKANGLKATVLDFKEIKKRGMGLLQAVGQGSERKPCLVHLAYTPKNAKKRYVFVGKGVTFDTGGISIKPAAGMQEMKHDMSGAANIVGFMQAIAALKPDVEVHGIMPCAENMPDGTAYRPGDVWTSYEGKTVEIVNTDAEGRLILADAMTYAQKLEPDFLIDNATLTGACVVALGTTASAWYANGEEAAKEFGAAVTTSGEQMWRMPLLEELKDQLKSEVADLKNAGDRYGGSISAALFLREFIGSIKNWVHADIAGPAMADRTFRWDPKGGTGHGVLTFLALVENATRQDRE
jgi:leucyl aminopeptidase